MNQLFLAKGYDTEVGAMAREIESYAVSRAGGKAWEYQFVFGGGRPPWVSGLAQGTAHPGAVARRRPAEGPALVRRRAQRARHLPHARRRPACASRPRRARTTSPTPTRPGSGSTTPSCSPSSGCTTSRCSRNDPLGRRLYLDGERRARVEIRSADTGSWSLYQPGVASDIGYHKVLRDFTRGLCSRLNLDRQRAAIALRERRKDPGAVLGAFDRYPDAAPFCIAQQRFNHYLYARLKALGLPGPWG